MAVAITASGLELLAAIEAPLATWLDDWLGRLGEPDLKRLSRLLERLREEPAREPD